MPRFSKESCVSYSADRALAALKRHGADCSVNDVRLLVSYIPRSAVLAPVGFHTSTPFLFRSLHKSLLFLQFYSNFDRISGLHILSSFSAPPKMSQSTIDAQVNNVIKYCQGFRVNKRKAQVLGHKCLELSQEFERVSRARNLPCETRVRDVLSNTANFTERWSKKCICWQWIFRHQMAQDIALAHAETCDLLLILHNEQRQPPINRSPVLSIQRPTPPPPTPSQKPLPLPSLSQHSLTISISTAFARSQPHSSRSSTLSTTASGQLSPIQSPSPLSLSMLSFASVPDPADHNPLLFTSSQLAPVVQPSQLLSPIPASAICQSHSSGDHAAPGHEVTDVSVSRPELLGEAIETGGMALDNRSYREPTHYTSDTNQKSPAPESQVPVVSHGQSIVQLTSLSPAPTIRKQKPELKIKIPTQRHS